jgi:predicted RNase H-like HicB family nuclease
VWQEGDWWVAQAIEVNVASRGKSREEAKSNLREALELYFEPDVPSGLDSR